MTSDALISYQVKGAGSPLLLIHGFGVTYSIWRELSPLLQEYFCLVLIELPGIGASALPTGNSSYTDVCIQAIESVRQELVIPKWSVLGYSTGVGAAAAYASAHSQRVDRVVLVCPPLLKGWRWAVPRALFWLDGRYPGIGDWFLTGWRLYWLVALIGFNGRPCRLTGEWVDEIITQPLPVLKATLREFPPVHRLLAGMTDSTLLLCGTQDMVIPRSLGSSLQMVFFTGDHSGPARMAPPIATAVINFLSPTLFG